MPFMNSIISWLKNTEWYFYEAYLEVLTWLPPLNYLSDPLLRISRAFGWFAYYFSEFNVWLVRTSDQVAEFLTESDIYNAFKNQFDRAVDAWNWVKDAWTNITNIVNEWWLGTTITVQGWIDIARQALQSQVDSLTSQLASLQSDIDSFIEMIPSLTDIVSWFSDWWNSILTRIVAWGALTATQIDSLIDSWFRSYQPFWEGWQEWRDKVIEFFTDPEDWLYKALDRIVERFW